MRETLTKTSTALNMNKNWRHVNFRGPRLLIHNCNAARENSSRLILTEKPKTQNQTHP